VPRRKLPTRSVEGSALLIALLVGGCGLIPPAPQDSLKREHWVHHAACEKIAAVAGPEDIAIDARYGIAYVSATDRWFLFGVGEKGTRPGDGRPGHIYAIDLNNDPHRARDVTPEELRRESFAPHGISFLPLPDGRGRLFVINHRYEATADGWDRTSVKDSIEIFDVDGMTLRRAPGSPLSDDRLLVSANDIAAIDETRFFVTNEHGSRPGVWRSLRDLFGLNDGNVVFYDGKAFRQFGPPISGANGVAVPISRDGTVAKMVRIASIFNGEIVSYSWTGSDPQPENARVIPLGTRPDNITIDPDDSSLLVAGHPKGLAFLAYALRWRERAPSQVIHIENPGEPKMRLNEVFEDSTGESVSAASVAAAYRSDSKHVLLIGNIFEPTLLVCDLARNARS
jgi:arylesterase / paraoxonase